MVSADAHQLCLASVSSLLAPAARSNLDDDGGGVEAERGHEGDADGDSHSFFTITGQGAGSWHTFPVSAAVGSKLK